MFVLGCLTKEWRKSTLSQATHNSRLAWHHVWTVSTIEAAETKLTAERNFGKCTIRLSKTIEMVRGQPPTPP